MTVSFHAELYKLIPEDHQLRKIHEVIDFTFIHELVRSSYCEYYGRPANEPELLFRLLFLQVLYNLSDDRIIEEAQVNLAYKWFLGLNPEDKLPDPSQLSRFRNHRLGAGAVDEVLKSVVRQCIEKGLVKSKTIIMDSTHTLAASQKQKPLEVLRDAAKRLFRVVVKKHPKLEKKLPRLPELKKDKEGAEKIMLHYLAELGETVQTLLPDHEGSISEKVKIAKAIVEDERLLANKGIMSAIDPDARFGWKSNMKSFFGYKEHIAMTEEEIITAVEVTGGSSDDGKQFKELLNQTLATGIEVQEVIGDTAYSSKDNLAEMKSKEIQPVVPLNPVVHNGGLKQEGFEYNKDADFVICPAGQHSVRKAVQGSKQSGESRSLVFYFDTEKCKTCPLREGCFKPGAKSKTYSIRIVAEHYKEQIEFENSDTFKERIRRRPIIEHKNAELKRYHGMTKAKYRGLFRMQIQAILTAFVVNAKRMVTLIEKMQPAS
ncbi:IS1182 family transposase [Brevibacillus centrosporus]|nr:IS1182 family transposase [Brevibacillus centrosporus]MEC2129311.1 IS1182 family transposase [Brevibacillus centrosporus]